MILAGDVGGTKTALALFETADGGLRLLRDGTLASREFHSLEAAIAAFLGAASPSAIDAACLGVAGPIVGGRGAVTNLPWVVDEARLVTALVVPRVRLLNDLEATAHGVLALPDDRLHTLQTGEPRRGNVAVIAAGTGLGEAIVAAGARPLVVATEGGHVDFAPRTELEDRLLAFLRREFGHVSYERILSGAGLFNVYRFLRQAGQAPEREAVAARLRGGDPAAVITELALAYADPLCVSALDLFVTVYGAEAGNLALKALAVGGVVVAGGIAPRILPRLVQGRFLDAFRDKGRLSPVMATIPVRVALDPRAPLLGAASVAAALLAAPPD
ncbi:MAG TPA: glucokinase [Methylomirabilota bacterium]|nr:glucokinase [Methylomirabilota bacterium]